jgi:pyruvate dehydrogenase E1 component alpha subunit/2-oxoisovalerate dehydrogenase E1 component alpha subunit
LCGHGEHDDAHYVETKLKHSGLGRDCLKVAEEFLVGKSFADSTSLALWRNEAIREVEHAVAMVQREGAPDPFAQEWSALSTTRLMEAQSEKL